MTPYEAKMRGGLAVNGGDDICVELDFPGRGVISHVIVKQTAGDPVDFTVAIFRAERPCSGASAESDSDSDAGDTPPGEGPLHDDLYRASPDLLSDTPGSLMYFADGFGFVYKCAQENFAGPERRVWLRISPGGSGAKMFCATLGGYTYNP